jgi:hypothetical protein
MPMGPALMVYDHLALTLSGYVSVLHDRQPDVPTVCITKRALTMEENADALFA